MIPSKTQRVGMAPDLEDDFEMDEDDFEMDD